MINIDLIRSSPALVIKDLERRRMPELVPAVHELRAKDAKWRTVKSEVEKIRAERNKLSRQVNEAKKAGRDVQALLAEAKEIPSQIEKKERTLARLQEFISRTLLQLPNMLDGTVPLGEVDGGNVEVRTWGRLPKFSFSPRNHIELCESLDLADFERSSKIAGKGFYFLKNELVLLEQALVRFALDTLRKKGFTLTAPPLLLRHAPYQGVTDLAAFQEVMYKIEQQDAYLIATSEHPLVAQFMQEILGEKQLPIRLAGVSSCFRKEAGRHSVDEKGLFRVHQFTKVEQVVVCTPEESGKWHEELLANAEEIFQALGLPYRVMLLCSADTGRVMAKTYDLEVWMPHQQQYREAVSCSTATDYQARRLGIRYRAGSENRLVHTLNSTAVATTRALVAILENGQQKDGSVKVPDVLVPYMGGIEVIEKR